MKTVSTDRKVVVLQPGYLPWLGFFEQMARCDVFVFYDDVQFDKHSWRNRNRIKSVKGPQWLTVPVKHKGLDKPLIKEIRIDSRAAWARKHLQSVRTNYSKAGFFDRYFPGLEEVLNRPWKYLVDLDVALVEWICRELGLEREILFSSQLGVGGSRSGRLLDICLHLKAATYLSGAAARDYLDTDLFARQGIGVVFQDYAHPVYPQLFGEFIPYLSVLDLLLNAGPESLEILAPPAPARPEPKCVRANPGR